MYDLAKAVRQIHEALERAIVVLDSAQTTAQAFLLHWIGKGGFQTSFPRIEAIFVDTKHFSENLRRKGLVLKIIEGSHDTRHVDPLLVGVQTHCSRHLGFEGQILTIRAHVAERQAKTRDAHLQNGHVGALHAGASAILDVRERSVVLGSNLELLVVLPTNLASFLCFRFHFS